MNTDIYFDETMYDYIFKSCGLPKERAISALTTLYNRLVDLQTFNQKIHTMESELDTLANTGQMSRADANLIKAVIQRNPTRIYSTRNSTYYFAKGLVAPRVRYIQSLINNYQKL